MSIVYLLAPLALLMAAGFIAACLWALSVGQFDDLETPAQRILRDENLMTLNKQTKKTQT